MPPGYYEYALSSANAKRQVVLSMNQDPHSLS
jgi:hypothetical protein